MRPNLVRTMLPFLLAACGDATTPPTPTPAVATVEISGGDVALHALTRQLQRTAVAHAADGSALANVTVTWGADDEAVATVSPTGTITAVGVGTTSVTASADGISASVEVTVDQVLAGVTVSASDPVIVGTGRQQALIATARDSAGTAIPDRTFSWSSDDPSVATVDMSGLVVSVDYGTVNISAATGGIDGAVQLRVAPGLDYASWYGGAPAGQWDRANFDAYVAQVPNLVATYQSASIYTKPVHPELSALARSNVPPDVISSPIAGGLRDLVAEGLIADISDLWVEAGWDTLFPASIVEMASVDGKRYFVPQALQWNPIFYNLSIFNNLSVSAPTTWDEVLELCDTLNAAGVYPFTVSAFWSPPLARWFTMLNMRLNGHAFHERLMRGQETYTDPRVRDVFVRWAELFARGCFSPTSGSNDYGAAVNDLASGTAAMWNIGEWLFESLSGTQAANMDFFAFPAIDAAVDSGEIVHVYGAFLHAAAEHPEQGRAMLRYLGDVTSQTSFVQALNRVASNLAVDSTLYNDLRLRGRALVRSVPHVTPLFEVATDPNMSSLGLNVFFQFWNNPDPATIDGLLAQLEAQRQVSYP